MKKYYIYLDIIHGIEEIKNIHNKLYKDILKTDKGKNYKFIPHITLGTIDKIKNDIFIEEFETIIDKVYIESIGENEESIIEFEIKLKGE